MKINKINMMCLAFMCLTIVCILTLGRDVNYSKPIYDSFKVNSVLNVCDSLQPDELLKKVDDYLYIEESNDKACDCLRIGVRRGIPDAYAVWGQMMLNEHLCTDTINEAKGILYMKKSMDNGSTLGMRLLAHYYIKINDITTGLSLLELASKKKDAAALYEYGSILLDGNFSVYGMPNIKSGILVDNKKGVKLMEQSADNDNPYAMLRMADILYSKNIRRSYEYIVNAYKIFEKNNEESYLLDIEERLNVKYRSLNSQK